MILADLFKNAIQKIDDTDKKIPDVTKTDYNAKITEIEGKIPIITRLATTAALTAVENKICNVSNLVKKTNYDEILSDTESKYFTTSIL